MVREILVVEREDSTRRAPGPRAIPHPELEAHGRILRLSANLVGRKVAPKPTLLSIQLCALEIRIRDCKSSFVTIERPYHVVVRRYHQITN